MTKQTRFAIAGFVAAMLWAVPAAAQTAEEIAEKEAKAKAYEAQAKKDPTQQPKMKEAKLQVQPPATPFRARTADQIVDPTMPGPHHARLAKLAGEWNVSARVWIDPNRPPVESTGSVTNEMILGGRFLWSHYDGQMAGQPFQGIGIDGYDNVKQKHTSQWMDSAGTMVSQYEGGCGYDGNTITVFTSFDDPLTGAPKRLRGVTKILGDDKYTYESAAEVDGEYVKTMEAVFTRK